MGTGGDISRSVNGFDFSETSGLGRHCYQALLRLVGIFKL